jgi:hypothetical protein
VAGFDKVRARLKAGPVAALIEASDGSEQGRAKLRPLAAGAPVLAALTSGELGLAFGRDFVIHAALGSGGAAHRVVREASRLAGFRAASPAAFSKRSAGDAPAPEAEAAPASMGWTGRDRAAEDERAAPERPMKDGS